MKNPELKILMVGAGGIGGITAAHIARAGFNIEIIDNIPGYSEIISSKGIHVSGHCHEFTQKLTAGSDISEVKDKKDIILVATKVNALESIINDIQPLLHEDSVVVSLQNSMSIELLAKQVGESRVIGCVVGWGATAHAPGKLEKTSDGAFEIGGVAGNAIKHFSFVKEVLETTAPVIISDNIYGDLYSKLIINSCITTLGAISGLTLGKMLSNRRVRNISISIIKEAVIVGRAAGVSIAKFAGRLDFNAFADDNSWHGRLKKHLLISIVGFKYRKLKSSSLQSLQAGQRTEVDHLNGFISSRAKAFNLPTPVNDMLVQMVHEIEDGRRGISLSNLELPFFNQYNHSF